MNNAPFSEVSVKDAPDNVSELDAGTEAFLQSLRARIGKAQHDLNNPLSIISGNTQLLLELARHLGIEDELSGPLNDIDRAVGRLIDSSDDLGSLRAAISAWISSQGGSED